MIGDIAIVNYGLGNIKAIVNIYNELNINVKVVSNVTELSNIKSLILPGVGSFDLAMMKLNQSGMREKLDELVLKKKLPILGICVGMQIMANSSDEGKLKGLGWINGEVKFLKPKTSNDLVPHMGWNSVYSIENNNLFNEIKNNYFYFLHSYFFKSNSEINKLTYTRYVLEFASSFQNENIFGVQFHPEKSHLQGKILLKNFADL